MMDAVPQSASAGDVPAVLARETGFRPKIDKVPLAGVCEPIVWVPIQPSNCCSRCGDESHLSRGGEMDSARSLRPLPRASRSSPLKIESNFTSSSLCRFSSCSPRDLRPVPSFHNCPLLAPHGPVPLPSAESTRRRARQARETSGCCGELPCSRGTSLGGIPSTAVPDTQRSHHQGIAPSLSSTEPSSLHGTPALEPANLDSRPEILLALLYTPRLMSKEAAILLYERRLREQA